MNNLFSVKDKIVLVTGAGSGIGKAIADGFKEAGSVVFYGIHNLKDKNDSFKYQLNIEDSKSRSQIMKAIIESYKHLDILINAAGITNSGYSQVYWQNTLNINLTAIYDMCNYASLFMKQYGGSIINVTSINSEVAGSDNPAYNVSKAGLKMLTKSLAKDLAQYNIRVNNLCPGYVRTKMTNKSFNDDNKRIKREERIMMGRFAHPEEMIGPAIFLASNASSYMTGSDLIIDGGFLCNGI